MPAGEPQPPTGASPPPPLRPDWQDRPHPSRLAVGRPDRDRILAAHRAAVETGQVGYLDPSSGLFVMTAVHLRDRGWCCDRGCRHCPYVGATHRLGRGGPTSTGDTST